MHVSIYVQPQSKQIFMPLDIHSTWEIKKVWKIICISAILYALLSCDGLACNTVMFPTKSTVFQILPTGSGLFETKLVLRELLTNGLRAFVPLSLIKSSHYLRIHCLFHKKKIHLICSLVYDSGVEEVYLQWLFRTCSTWKYLQKVITNESFRTF